MQIRIFSSVLLFVLLKSVDLLPINQSAHLDALVQNTSATSIKMKTIETSNGLPYNSRSKSVVAVEAVQNRNLKTNPQKTSIVSLVLYNTIAVFLLFGLSLFVKFTFFNKLKSTNDLEACDKKAKLCSEQSGQSGQNDSQHQTETNRMDGKILSDTESVSHRTLLRRQNRERYPRKHKKTLNEMETSYSEDDSTDCKDGLGLFYAKSLSLTDSSSFDGFK